MKHERFSELLILSLYGELSSEENELLTDHLLQCANCRRERKDLKELHSVLTNDDPGTPEYLLWQARDELFLRLRRETVRPRGRRNWVRVLGFQDWNWATAGRAVALLIAGFFVGYLTFGLGVESELDPFGGDQVRISDLSLEESNGEVDISFSAARDFRLKGSLNDPKIQRFLAHAVVNEQNAGTRLRAVHTISSQTVSDPDAHIQGALVLALKKDENPAVRQQALNALRNYSFNEKIRNALVYVLMHDQNARLRIEAINTLEMAHLSGQPLEQDVLGALRQKLNTDENKYIRLRAKAVLEEVEPQFF